MEKIKFKDFIKNLSEKHDIPQNIMEELVRSIFEEIKKFMKFGEVSIPQFGKFWSSIRKGGVRRNPKTGEVINVDDKQVPKFSPSVKLKDEINS